MFIVAFSSDQVYFDILEESKISAPKLCKMLEEHGILMMEDKPYRCAHPFFIQSIRGF